MAERKEEEWLGEPMPYFPGKYTKDRFEQGLHRPSDHLTNFNPAKSRYDAEMLGLVVIAFALGFSVAYLIDKHRNKYPSNLVFV